MNKKIGMLTLIYMAIAIKLYPIAEQENRCIMDDCVFGMRPLWYFITVVIPLFVQNIFCWKKDFLPAVILRRNSWKNNLYRQEIKCCLVSAFYAGAFLCLVMVSGAGKTVFNWNTIQSYYALKTGELCSYSVYEIFMFLLFLCFVRNFIIVNLVLAFLWEKGNGIYGFFVICVIYVFEICQEKIRIFNWLISPDYRVWASRENRIYTIIGIIGYLILGKIIFSKILNRKEILNE